MLHVGDIVTIDRQPNIPLGEIRKYKQTIIRHRRRSL